MARLGVDLDHRDVRAERERRSAGVEDLLGAQLVEPSFLPEARVASSFQESWGGRADDVERAGLGVEHDVIDARLELFGRELAGPFPTTWRPAPAATPPIWVDFEP